MRAPPRKRKLSAAEIALAEEDKATARENFLAFRHYVRPKLIPAWWQQDAADHLMDFWADLKAGKRPALVIQAPPQHGKTEGLIDFMAWAAGGTPTCGPSSPAIRMTSASASTWRCSACTTGRSIARCSPTRGSARRTW